MWTRITYIGKIIFGEGSLFNVDKYGDCMTNIASKNKDVTALKECNILVR